MKSVADMTSKARYESFDLTEPLPADRLLMPLGYVQIMFKGQLYTLRQTRNDKLILTK
jgi:hemin uptake protein HemP